MNAIPEWRKAWRLLSIQLAAAAAVFGILPLDQQEAILSFIGLSAERVPLVLGLLFVAARLVRQPEVLADAAQAVKSQ